ncbi:MAG: response regulator [Actinomycetota bacterium]
MAAFVAVAEDGRGSSPRGVGRRQRQGTPRAHADVAPPPTVLLVEDDLLGRVALREALLAKGFAVVEAGTARAAFDAIANYRLDSVVLDIQLPDVSGIEVLRRMKQTPDTRGIPVVVLTAFGTHPEKEHAVREGCDAFVVKPPNLGELIDLLREFGHRPPDLRVVDPSDGDDL